MMSIPAFSMSRIAVLAASSNISSMSPGPNSPCSRALTEANHQRALACRGAAEHGEHAVGQVDALDGGAPAGPRPGRDLDVLGDGEVREDAGIFRRPAQPEPGDLVGAAAVDGPPMKLDRARSRPEIAHDRPQGRRLARAVATDQADDLTGPDLERHAAQDVARLDEDVDAGEAQHADARDVPGLRPTTVSITRWSARIAAGTASASTLP